MSTYMTKISCGNFYAFQRLSIKFVYNQHNTGFDRH